MFAPSISPPVSRLDQSLAQLRDAIADVRRDAAEAPAAGRADAVAAALRATDALMAMVVDLVGRGGYDATAGMPAAMHLQMQGRRPRWEAHAISTVAEARRRMPRTAEAFQAGDLSWPQMRAITRTCTGLRSEARAAMDAIIAAHAPGLAGADPQRLIELVEDKRIDLAPAPHTRQENRAIERGFFAVQPSLDGGGRFWGEADAESFATILAATEAKAGRPVDESETGITRSQQRLDALVAICEDSLSGEGPPTRTRPKPRFLATIDISAIDAKPAARILWAMRGRAPKLTTVTADTLACDATLIPVIFDGPRPIAVGGPATPFEGKLKTAVVARDQGCTFMACDLPASFCDGHHITPGYGQTPDEVVLLCRRHHRMVHKFGYKILMRPDGFIEYSRGGRTWVRAPRYRDPPTIE